MIYLPLLCVLSESVPQGHNISAINDGSFKKPFSRMTPER